MYLIYSQVPSPLGYPSILYKYPWRDSNPQKTMGLNHVHMPVLLQGHKVHPEGFEPPILTAAGLKPVAYTNSATDA